jgi:hypothetical protein
MKPCPIYWAGLVFLPEKGFRIDVGFVHKNSGDIFGELLLFSTSLLPYI